MSNQKPGIASPEELQLSLTRFPRLALSAYPTPLQPARRMGQALGVDLWLKRDDLGDPGLGGNKLRKLEFLMAEALEKGANAVITSGGGQSNHARLTAAVAARLGLECHLVLLGSENAELTGNLALDSLFGAKIHWREVVMVPELISHAEQLAEDLRRAGKVPYLIPIGGSTALGELGYVNCLLELHRQLAEQSLDLSRVRLVCTAGSCGTLAGLLAAKKITGSPLKLTGISVSGRKRWLVATITRLANETGALLGYPLECAAEDFEVYDDFIGPGYAIPTPEGWAAIRLAGRTEGIVLDPVYTGKAMAGLVGLLESGRIARDEHLVFLHTGGSPAFFAYSPPGWPDL